MGYLKKSIPIIAVLLVIVGSLPPAYSQGILYGSDRNGEIFTVNIGNGMGTSIGTLATPGSTEIECTADGSQCFSQQPDGFFAIEPFDPTIAVLTGPPLSTSGRALNGLEYVGNTLYGAGITFTCLPATLFTLDPTTANSLMAVGAGLGTGHPMSGLAYDTVNNIMYGIDGCGSSGPSNLYTVNLGTGIASPVGNTGVRLASLEFGPDGQLYAGGDTAEGGNIYTIITGSAVATLLGPSGFSQVTGLTLVEPGLEVNVGGEYFTLDTTAVLLAGIQTNALWIIPVLMGAAGIGIVLVRKKN